jgi:membrane fusion protein, copper/silver efflux system
MIVKPLLLIAGVLLLACQEKAGTYRAAAASAGADTAPSGPVFPAPDSFQAGLGKVYAGYVDIQAALAADDFQAAQAAFSAMHGTLHIIQTDGLDSSAKAYWDTSTTRIMEVLHPMATSGNIDTMRLHFMDFTPALLDAIDKFGVSSTAGIYLFHCPMARKNQGAEWLQKDSLIANPYFGKSMLKCGNLIRKVKA